MDFVEQCLNMMGPSSSKGSYRHYSHKLTAFVLMLDTLMYSEMMTYTIAILAS